MFYLKKRASGVYVIRVCIDTKELQLSLRTRDTKQARLLYGFIILKMQKLGMNPTDISTIKKLIQKYYQEAISDSYQAENLRESRQKILTHSELEFFNFGDQEEPSSRLVYHPMPIRDVAQAILDEIRNITQLTARVPDNEYELKYLDKKKKIKLEEIQESISQSDFNSETTQEDYIGINPFQSLSHHKLLNDLSPNDYEYMPKTKTEIDLYFEKKLLEIQIKILQEDAKRLNINPNLKPVETAQILLSEAAEDYLKNIEKTQQANKQTVIRKKSKLQLCNYLLENKAINFYTFKDFEYLRDRLLQLPANRKLPSGRLDITKSFLERKKHINEIIKSSNKAAKLSNISVNNYLMELEQCFKYYINIDVLDRSKLKLKVLKTKTESIEKKAFDSANLKIFFSLKDFLDIENTLSLAPQRFWIPIIAFFSGMRMNEICQLHFSDIRNEDGFLVFDVNDNDKLKTAKSVKNEDSKRLIPIHNFLLECGFLEFINKQKKRKSENIFFIKNKTMIKEGSWSKAYARTQSNLLRSVIQDKQISFHSSRHTVVTKLQNNKEREIVIQKLIGHKSKNVTGTVYTHSEFLEEGKEAINKLSYPEIEEILNNLKTKARIFYSLD